VRLGLKRLSELKTRLDLKDPRLNRLLFVLNRCFANLSPADLVGIQLSLLSLHICPSRELLLAMYTCFVRAAEWMLPSDLATAIFSFSRLIDQCRNPIYAYHPDLFCKIAMPLARALAGFYPVDIARIVFSIAQIRSKAPSIPNYLDMNQLEACVAHRLQYFTPKDISMTIWCVPFCIAIRCPLPE
jgi:hypothetical protein